MTAKEYTPKFSDVQYLEIKEELTTLGKDSINDILDGATSVNRAIAQKLIFSMPNIHFLTSDDYATFSKVLKKMEILKPAKRKKTTEPLTITTNDYQAKYEALIADISNLGHSAKDELRDITKARIIAAKQAQFDAEVEAELRASGL